MEMNNLNYQITFFHRKQHAKPHYEISTNNCIGVQTLPQLVSINSSIPSIYTLHSILIEFQTLNLPTLLSFSKVLDISNTLTWNLNKLSNKEPFGY